MLIICKEIFAMYFSGREALQEAGEFSYHVEGEGEDLVFKGEGILRDVNAK